MSDKEAEDNKSSGKVKGIDNPDDEEDLLDTHPPSERAMNASFIINSAFGKSGTDIHYPTKKEEKK